ncbi:PQQ-dependent sugar dehydrogenase [Hymenobacter actinosclerus]|uniref:Glucose/arabinose dehydrogenase, beta-propeller fold n=1 Tax=Hymenobacter actinosclerus TaxID=82805 RepID=A0A1H9ZTF8_9BACT|nr:sorbosone dehydrogenase family protein [Hymenobacter actinosclerus]SES84552.1 Glucose/arabinose dehydrogenase, beta-propeller fold [Hymenobacter actinosclerus]
MTRISSLLAAAALLLTAACGGPTKQEKTEAAVLTPADTVATKTDSLTLPEPYATKSVTKRSKIVEWPQATMPTVPTGFLVTQYAADLESPRNMYVLPNGDVLVAEANTVPTGPKEEVAAALKLDPSKSLRPTSANRITLLRDEQQVARPSTRTVFLDSLNQPFGMLLLGGYFYVANTDGVWRYPYVGGQTSITAKGQKILDLPAGGYNNHWTRNLLASPDGHKIYISVGSSSNVGEHGMKEEQRRANIIEINPDGTGERIYASGLRNPVGMDWAPGTNVLWTAVNERDELGDELVPDYLTSVREGGFYGWPYSYFGQHVDPRRKDEKPELVKKAIVPDVPLGPHTASLGLAFYTGDKFPEPYRNGAFIGQHGSWNRSEFSGYKVVFVPFRNGKPAGQPQDFLTGFIANEEKNEVYGRPVGVTVLPTGAMLVADDAGGKIWRIAAQ